jgi:hypothetical protein
MQFAMSHNAVPSDRPGETREASAAKQQRVSTTATLLAVAACAILAKGHLLEARTPALTVAVAQNAGTAPVTIVAPEFCKDQTWPYIDSRCLRRVDNPAPPDDTHQAIAPPATTAATPAPASGSAKAVAAPPANLVVATPTSTPPAATAPSAPDSRAQVIQSVFPTAEATASRDNDIHGAANAATDAPAYQRTSDVPQHRRSRHNHSGYFGFRF